MKKQLLGCLIALASFSATQALAATGDGTITIKGVVTDLTCEISAGNSPNPSPLGVDYTLNLQPVSSTVLNGGPGKTAMNTPFYIKVGGEATSDARCDIDNPDTVIAGINFEIINENIVAGNPGVLQNKSTDDPAAGVAIRVLDTDQDPIEFGAPSVSISPDMQPDNGTVFKYFAQYFSLAASVGPGNVEGYAVYSVSYR